MLSREPPYQPDGYLHGEHNLLILRFKDPRIAMTNSNAGEAREKIFDRGGEADAGLHQLLADGEIR